MGASVAGLLAIAAYGPPAPSPLPLLVGHGCDGSSGPLYAEEESDFPFCDEIKPADEGEEIIYHSLPTPPEPLPFIKEYEV